MEVKGDSAATNNMYLVSSVQILSVKQEISHACSLLLLPGSISTPNAKED
jgi:hypothetical protein